MRRVFVAAAFGLIAAGIAGCAPSNTYVPPDLAPASAAIVVGSKNHDENLLAADTRVFLASIDGKLTLDGPFGWDHRTVVAPGTHLIMFGVSTKTLFKNAVGVGKAQWDLEAGKTYVLRATDPTKISGLCARSSSWLEGEDGTPIGDKVPVVVATDTGAEIMVPGGGFVSIPSRTRCPPR